MAESIVILCGFIAAMFALLVLIALLSGEGW